MIEWRMCAEYEAQLRTAAKEGARELNRGYSHLLFADEDGESTGEGDEQINKRPKNLGTVITADRKPVKMKWGFFRRFKRKDGKPGPDGTGLMAPKPVVNAQSEKMGTFMWKDAYEHRRCIVPMTAFIEWVGTRVFRFHLGGQIMWVAGLWEDDPTHGLCYTCLTTTPNNEVAATGHDRCLVVLQEHEIDVWLDGGEIDFRRPDGMFQVDADVPNPRQRIEKVEIHEPPPPPDPPPPVQGELPL